jgi:hypothetical protein
VQGVDLGAVASSLSSTSGSLGESLDRMFSSASLQYSPPLSRSSFQRVYVAFAANSDLCLSLLRNCANYGEKVFTWCFSYDASSKSSGVGVPHDSDLRERTARLLSEAADISTENVGDHVASVEGMSLHTSATAMPFTDRGPGGNLNLLPIRVATMQSHVQEGLGFGTEDYV